MLTGYFNYASAELIIEDIIAVLLKSALSVVVLFFLTKLMGNKQISQLSFFDYVVGITIGSIGAELAISSTPVHFPIIAILVYAIASVIVSVLSLRSIRARRFLVGVPTVLVKDGKLLYNSLAKARVDVNEFLAEARIQGYFNIEDISYAVMETNGRFSFLPTSTTRPLTTGDMNITPPPSSPVANVIIDGVLMENNLRLFGKDSAWLRERLAKQGVDIQKVLLATLSEEYSLKIYYKSGEKCELSPFD